MSQGSIRWSAIAAVALFAFAILPARGQSASQAELIQNSDFRSHGADPRQPANYELSGDVTYKYLGDPNRDIAPWGIAMSSSEDMNHDGAHSGSVSQTVAGIDANAGKWFRFSFRGLPEDNFAVEGDDLFMKVEFFGNAGKTSYDGKIKKIYPLVELDRKNMTANGDRHVGGAAVWRSYELDFRLPFPQVTQLRLSVGFDHGAATRANAANFLVSNFSLVRLDRPELLTDAASDVQAENRPDGLIPIGGRWFFKPNPGQTAPPKLFDYTSASQLIYHDALWSAPFEGTMTSWLKAGDKDAGGNLVMLDRFVPDNVTVSFDATSMIIHTKGLPNHPTGKFPEPGRGPASNPNFIQEHDKTYFIPLDPKIRPEHLVTAIDNSNHALPMGPIGIAVNGVVFFNPFDANSQDASSMMDRCCGHPAPDNTYHYHKYPICINSPWADDGTAHSPVIGWAFDGFPIYGPYEKAGVMAKDITGSQALNGFNLHFDADRGWHYHVTPGKFPYIIGGFWGTEDKRDSMRGRGPPGGMRGGPPGQFGNRPPPPPWADGGPPPPPPDGQ